MSTYNWTQIFDLLKDEPSYTLEAISTLQMITSILQTGESLEYFRDMPEVLILKNNEPILGGLPYTLENQLVIAQLQPISQQIGNNQCNLQYPKYYVHIDSETSLRTFGVQWNDILAVYQIDINRNENQELLKKQSITRKKWIGFIISILIWILLLWIVNHFSFKLSLIDFIVYLLIGLVVAYFNTAEIVPSSSYSSELNVRSALNGRSLAISSVAIGLSFVVAYVQFPQSNLYLKYILLAFMLSLFSLLIPNTAKTGQAIRNSIIIQSSILNFALAFLVLACYTYLKYVYINK